MYNVHAAKPNLLVYGGLFLITTLFSIYNNIFLANICNLKNMELSVIMIIIWIRGF
jgi:hypothetical protein